MLEGMRENLSEIGEGAGVLETAVVVADNGYHSEVYSDGNYLTPATKGDESETVERTHRGMAEIKRKSG